MASYERALHVNHQNALGRALENGMDPKLARRIAWTETAEELKHWFSRAIVSVQLAGKSLEQEIMDVAEELRRTGMAKRDIASVVAKRVNCSKQWVRRVLKKHATLA